MSAEEERRSQKPSLISEERKRDILEKLKEERDIRKNLIAVGSTDSYLDKDIVHVPSKQEPRFKLDESEKARLLEKIFKERKKQSNLEQPESQKEFIPKQLVKKDMNNPRESRDSIGNSEENWESLVNRDYVFDSGEKKSARTQNISSDNQREINMIDDFKLGGNSQKLLANKNPLKKIFDSNKNGSIKFQQQQQDENRVSKDFQKNTQITNQDKQMEKDHLKSLKAKLLNSFEKKVKEV